MCVIFKTRAGVLYQIYNARRADKARTASVLNDF